MHRRSASTAARGAARCGFGSEVVALDVVDRFPPLFLLRRRFFCSLLGRLAEGAPRRLHCGSDGVARRSWRGPPLLPGGGFVHFLPGLLSEVFQS